MDCIYGIMIYDTVACSDFAGPLDVFYISNQIVGKGRVFTISPRPGIIECGGGLKVEADYTIESAPDLDVLLIPGAENARKGLDGKEPVVEWIRALEKKVTYLTSVCTGALILQAAGVLAGRKATTHWMFTEQLSKDRRIEVLPDMRYVRDGKIVTSQGVTAGIDMALWLIGQIHSPEHARTVQKIIHYNPAPPYTAAV